MHTNDLGSGHGNQGGDFIVAGGAGEAYSRPTHTAHHVHLKADDAHVVFFRIKPDRRTVVSGTYLGYVGYERRIRS